MSKQTDDTVMEPMPPINEPVQVWTTIPNGLEDREQVAIYVIEQLRNTLSLDEAEWRRVMAYHHDRANTVRYLTPTPPRQYSGPAYPTQRQRPDSHLRTMRTEQPMQEPYPPDDPTES